MDAQNLRSLVVKCTAGADDPERCAQAFTVATTALVAGASVSLWLAAGTLTVCTQCAARREISAADLIDRVLIRGSASFVEEILAPSVQALVY
jgi:predicted peroxiredoxin